ncbi:MAG: hypothetical protein GWN55_00725 [Phycisphaerae bacterium]|nr:hypothetical protein [candidate division KSB1 bacterium]NIU99855.1 hypothetical protein [Phycisphaerae bacterium]NIR68938.1 hypothetical protein [candidate division KSB1 bacterium]NIT69441.1 hypothetical protein [candidate division KSB1 bacterium]NIU23096.1 hypothetical protein [candidate division KSB1 bacterium]
MLISYILMLTFLVLGSCKSFSGEHARGHSLPGTLGNPSKTKQTEHGQPENRETDLSNITITKVADISNVEAALINAGRDQGLNLGDTFTAARKVNGEWVVVGDVKIIEVFQTSSVVRLLPPHDMKQEESPSLNIGDRFFWRK